MKRRHHDDLLKETFADGELDALREATLNRGLAAIRAKQKFRLLRNTVFAAAPLLLLVAALFWHAPIATAPAIVAPKTASLPSLKIYPAANVADMAPIPTISDQELMALYANRPVGLLGKPGQQKLVFFDQPTKSVD